MCLVHYLCWTLSSALSKLEPLCWSRAACYGSITVICAALWACMSSVCKLAEWEFCGNNWPINWFLSPVSGKNWTPPSLFLSFTLRRENQSKNDPPLDTYCHSLSIFSLHCCFSQVQSQLPRGHRALWQIAGPLATLFSEAGSFGASERRGTADMKKISKKGDRERRRCRHSDT